MEALLIVGGVTLALVGVAIAWVRMWGPQGDAADLARINGAPRIPVKQAAEGQTVKVVGQAQPMGEMMRAPLSQRPCIGYVLFITELQNNATRQLVQKRVTNDFLLEDPTGRLVVRGEGAQLLLEADESGEVGLMSRMTPALERLFGEYGINTSGIGRSFLYSEGVISEGERVAVLGVVGRETVGAGEAGAAGDGYRSRARFFLAAEGEQRLYVSDHAKSRV